MPPNTQVEGPLPTFVIAGTMRSGTTALARWLGHHPEVFMAPRKELHHFDSSKNPPLHQYLQEFADWSGQPAVGEATPNYLYADHAIERLVATVPDVRVVVSLREPVERAYSHYWARTSRALEDRPFAEVVADEQRHPVLEAGSGMGGPPALLARGRYLDQIQRALTHLPEDQLLAVLFDDVEQEPAQTYARICTFIGVDPAMAPPDVGRPANGYRRYRSERLRQALRRLPGPAADLIGHLNSRAATYPPLDPILRRALQDSYEADNQALARWLDRDLSSWNA